MGNRWGIPKDVEVFVLGRDQTCVYCGGCFGEERRTKRSWEHIVNDVSLSTVDNIALCCVGCNASKGAKLLAGWLQSDGARRRGISDQTLAPVVRAALSLAHEYQSQTQVPQVITEADRSSIRAAVDTEIEVTDSLQGRCAEITKQRDLSTKGERIGFRLETVTLGNTKWGAAATSCVVVGTDAPTSVAKTKRLGPVEGAVLEFLVARRTGIKKAEVVKHFEGRYEKGPVYRAIKSLVEARAVHESAGMVSIAGAAQ